MTARLLFVARTAARQRLGERGAIVARSGFYVLILFVFSRLWAAVLEGQPDITLRVDQLVWYVAITEWIVLSAPPVHTDVEDEVRRGDLAYRIARPLPYPLLKLAEGMGELVVRQASLGVAGLAIALSLTGRLPTTPGQLAWLLPLGLLAATIALLFQLGIGLSAFWLYDCRPIYWVWQKAGFILGGLMIPLDLYPAWLQQVAAHTPFAAMLYGPASLALGSGAVDPVRLLLVQLGWLAVTAVVLTFVFRRAVTRLELSGG